jgi:hypothetical protein
LTLPLTLPARGAVLATLWFPIADVLAGYLSRRTADPRGPTASGCTNVGGATVVRSVLNIRQMII